MSKKYSEINHSEFTVGAQLNDYYLCEIYPENRTHFKEVINKNIDFPAEYVYGLIGNKWLLQTFSGQIGVIGAKEKIDLIFELMKYPEYQNYLGLEKFSDYLYIPQKFACDDLNSVEEKIGQQLKNSTSKIFFVGIGHIKSGLLHCLKKYKNAIFLDVGGGIDMLAGCINIKRPYAGNWTNFRIKYYDYSKIDYMKYNGAGKHIFLK